MNHLSDILLIMHVSHHQRGISYYIVLLDVSVKEDDMANLASMMPNMACKIKVILSICALFCG